MASLNYFSATLNLPFSSIQSFTMLFYCTRNRFLISLSQKYLARCFCNLPLNLPSLSGAKHGWWQWWLRVSKPVRHVYCLWYNFKTTVPLVRCSWICSSCARKTTVWPLVPVVYIVKGELNASNFMPCLPKCFVAMWLVTVISVPNKTF